MRGIMENREIRKAAALAATAVAALLMLCAVLHAHGAAGKVNGPKETAAGGVTEDAPVRASVASGQAGEDETAAETGGELSADGYAAPGFGSGIEPYLAGGSRESLARLAADYNMSIPYCSDGADDSLAAGYLRSGPTLERPRHGMSSASYVVWVFRNTFGTCGSEFLDLPAMYDSGNRVTADALMPGDIGMYRADGGSGNHFGVCIGFYGGHPLFTHCSSVPFGDYAWGCNRVSYLKSENDAYFGGSAPVDFRCFVRPDLEWEE